jgi:glycosyltransferase involved in cell wall biosynthesis
LIVLDDGSRDNTLEFLKQHPGKFYFESHANMGQAKTLNKGWNLCKGQIIGYLSSDDLLTKNAVSLSVKTFMENPEVVLTYPDNAVINANSHYLYKYTAPSYDYYQMVTEARCKIGVGAFFLASAFQAIGGWSDNYRFMADYDHQIRLAQLGQFKHIPAVLGYSRQHPSAFSSSKIDHSAADEFIRLMTTLLDATSDAKLLARKSKILSRAYLFSGKTHWQSRRFKVALTYLSKSIKIHPGEIFLVLFNGFLKKTRHHLTGCFIKKEHPCDLK